MTTPSNNSQPATHPTSTPIVITDTTTITTNNDNLPKSPSSPFRPLSLPLFNPALNTPPSSLLTASAFAALSAGNTPVSSPSASLDNFTTPTTTQPTIKRRPSKLDRVARATREFRDSWIVPE